MSTFNFKTQNGRAEPNSRRVGTLSCNGISLETPAFVGITSRGVTPHVTPDLLDEHTSLQASYVALEDFLERGTAPGAQPPIFSPKLTEHAGSRLRRFTAYSDRQLLVLGARRSPPVLSPNSNSDRGVSVSTSTGFQHLDATEYERAATQLGADIVVGMGDFVLGERMGIRRREKLFGRSERWTRGLVDAVSSLQGREVATRVPAVFASVIPVPVEEQRWYLESIGEDLGQGIAGLAVYNPEVCCDLPESLASLPRLSMTSAETPQQLLREVENGVDLLTAPFVGAASDSGVALTFRFPSSSTRDTGDALGIDMLLPIHATDKQGLMAGCTCYACTKHSRAYVRHLLTAKEMLAWTLLQLHNIHVMHDFFAGVRASIVNKTFEADCAAFEAAYAAELPEASGIGPRVRGYQKKSGGPSDRKMNAKAYQARADEAKAAAVTYSPKRERRKADSAVQQDKAVVQE